MCGKRFSEMGVFRLPRTITSCSEFSAQISTAAVHVCAAAKQHRLRGPVLIS
jgi:hypothetical protein